MGLTHDVVVGASYSHASEKQYSADLDPALNVPVNVYRWNPHSVPKPSIGAYSSAGPTKTTQRFVRDGAYQSDRTCHGYCGYVDSWWMSKCLRQTSRKMAVLPLWWCDLGFNPQWSWYSSYSTVYQPQTGKRGAGKCSSLLKGKLETGVKGALFNGGLNLSGAIYQIDIKNNPQLTLRTQRGL